MEGSVSQVEARVLIYSTNIGWPHTVLGSLPPPGFRCELLRRNPTGRHELVPLPHIAGLGLVTEDPGKLVSPATVVKVAVGQHHLQGLLWLRPQAGTLQELSQAVNSDPSVDQEITVSPRDGYFSSSKFYQEKTTF